MGLQRVGHNWATELNWSIWGSFFVLLLKRAILDYINPSVQLFFFLTWYGVKKKKNLYDNFTVAQVYVLVHLFYSIRNFSVSNFPKMLHQWKLQPFRIKLRGFEFRFPHFLPGDPSTFIYSVCPFVFSYVREKEDDKNTFLLRLLVTLN